MVFGIQEWSAMARNGSLAMTESTGATQKAQFLANQMK